MCVVGELRPNGVLGSSLGGGHCTLGWAPTPTPWAASGRLRTLQAIHAPLIASNTAPAGTVGGVAWAPIVSAYTRPKMYIKTGQPVEIRVPSGPGTGCRNWLIGSIALQVRLQAGGATMMGTKERNFRSLPDDISLEELVPKDNLYRRLQEKLDLSFVRELVEDRYAASGRPSIDPEVFFRLQLVMFHEGIRSERELMRIVSDRLSVRWYVGYDLHEPLPDHSSLTRIRDRFGLSVFREFFERIVEECVEAGLVWGEELYFDATKVDANASLESIAPRFYVEEHLGELFTDEEELVVAEQEAIAIAAYSQYGSSASELYELPSADDQTLVVENAAKDDWISRDGRQRREQKGVWYRR